MSERPRFHLAIPVDDLRAARRFYTGTFGCAVGRESERWIDFDFFGHQVTAHLVEPGERTGTNPVDGKQVPVRHFGVILQWDDWHQLAQRLRDNNFDFLIEPYIRFKGQIGEQATMFIVDPSGNGLEFKSFRDMSQIFAR